MTDSDFINPNEIPANWTPVTPGGNQTAPPPHGPTPDYIQGTIASTLQHDAVLSETKYKGAGIPVTPLMPIGPGATAQVNAATQSVVKVFGGGSGRGVLLQTDNLNNADQSKLNLISGSNITLTPDQTGGVSIAAAASGSGPGLAIGDVINYPQIDAASVILVDDFCSGIEVATVNAAGALGWFFSQGTGTNFLSMSSAFPNPGIIRFSTGTSNNVAVRMFPEGGQFPFANYTRHGVFNTEKPGWKLTWVFRMTEPITGSTPTTTSLVFYLGLAASRSSITTSTRVPCGIWLRFDTSLSDTTYKFETVTNATASATQGTVVDSTIAPDFNWHRLQIRSILPGKALFKLDNGIEQEISIPQINSDDWSGMSRTSNVVKVNAFGPPPPISGQTIVVTGGNPSSFNGTFTVLQLDDGNTGTSSPAIYWLQTDINQSASDAFLAYTPAMSPFVMWGNSASGTPNQKLLDIDFFAFIYNPMLATSWASTPSDPSLARYYAAAT